MIYTCNLNFKISAKSKQEAEQKLLQYVQKNLDNILYENKKSNFSKSIINCIKYNRKIKND